MRMRSSLATAASILLASTVLAAAQGMQKQGPGAEGAPGQVQQEGQGKQTPQKSDRRDTGKQDTGKQKGAAQVEEPKQQQGKQQNQKEQRAEPKGKSDERNQAQKERNDAQKGERTDGQRGERNDTQKGERNDAQKGERTEGRGDKTLTVEQKTKVRETVLRGGNAPRVTRTTINFSINVGTAVPRSVHVVDLPPLMIEYYPAYRGYLYFIVDDEIIIVDRNYRIIAVLQV